MPDLSTRTNTRPGTHEGDSWGGWSRTDRAGFLSSHNLSVGRGAHSASRRGDVVLTGLMALILFAIVVIGCAVVWPSYLTCHHLQQTTGLIGGQTLTTCTTQTALWRLSPSR